MNINEIKSRVRIEVVISDYVNLESIGIDRFRGLCPFREESKPSFTVYADTRSFYCYGCGAGGDVINFLMKIENISFIEAIKKLKKYM